MNKIEETIMDYLYAAPCSSDDLNNIATTLQIVRHLGETDDQLRTRMLKLMKYGPMYRDPATQRLMLLLAKLGVKSAHHFLPVGLFIDDGTGFASS